MKKLSIAIAVESLHLHGGVERRTSELVKGLISAGHEVHIYANRWDARAAVGASFHRIPILRLTRRMKPISFAWFCSRLISRSKHDLIHTQARIFDYDVATLGVGCHRAYLDAVGIDSASDSFHRTMLAIERAMYRPGKYSRIIVNSHMVKGEIIRYYGVPEERIAVVHNGVDSEMFSPANREKLREAARQELGLTPDDIAIGYTGSGFHRKGLDTLIEAVGKSRHSDKAKILIVGRGNRDDYEKLAVDCGMGGRLVWVGQSADIARQYAAADVFALPTRYDPFANSTMEALACGLPVVTTRSNGVSEILTDGEDAFVVEAGDSNALADRLDALLADSDLRRRMGSSGRATVEPFTWDRTTGQTMDVYDAVVAERSARR